MTVRIYRSTDGSAPTLTGQAGSLTTLLDAVLVNGYGSQTAAGWSINQTTTNKRGYLQNTTGANNPSGVLLYVDDTGPGAGGAREARVCGFETMSAITPTGTGQFPSAAQSAIGVGTLAVRKSTTADATARAWTIVANGQTIYFFAETGDQTNPIAAFPFVFGDFKSYKTSDTYAVAIVGRNIENSANAANDYLSALPGFVGSNTWTAVQTIPGHFVDRSWTGVGGSIPVGKYIDLAKMSWIGTSLNQTVGAVQLNSTETTALGTTGGIAIGRNFFAVNFAYPNGSDGAMWLSPIWINHNNGFRGYFAGLWAPLHDRPLNHNDPFTVSGGNLNGKSFVMQNIPAYIAGNTDNGQIAIETSDTWT